MHQGGQIRWLQHKPVSLLQAVQAPQLCLLARDPEVRALQAFANPAEMPMTSRSNVPVASAPSPSPQQAKGDVLRQPVPASVNVLKMHLSLIRSTFALI